MTNEDYMKNWTGSIIGEKSELGAVVAGVSYTPGIGDDLIYQFRWDYDAAVLPFFTSLRIDKNIIIESTSVDFIADYIFRKMAAYADERIIQRGWQHGVTYYE